MEGEGVGVVADRPLQQVILLGEKGGWAVGRGSERGRREEEWGQ